MTDVLGNNIHLVLSSVAAALPHVKEGRVRALAVTSSTRSAALPDVPTIAESVLPGYGLDAWFAVMAPAKTPPAAVEVLSNYIGAAMKTPATQQKVRVHGIERAVHRASRGTRLLHQGERALAAGGEGSRGQRCRHGPLTMDRHDTKGAAAAGCAQRHP
jgi:tripartite-type tricarboxylate transporter receptor subunit TctC